MRLWLTASLLKNPWLSILPLVTVLMTLMPSASSGAGSRIALGFYRPEFPDNMSALTEYEAGTQMSIVHWYALWGDWKSAFNRADLDRVKARGALPLITWEPWAAVTDDPRWSLRNAILSGQHDAYIESWARGLADYSGPVLLRFAHEMHHQAYPWAV